MLLVPSLFENKPAMTTNVQRKVKINPNFRRTRYLNFSDVKIANINNSKVVIHFYRCFNVDTNNT